MTKRVLHADPETGSISLYSNFWGDDGRRKMAIENLQDVEPIMEAAKARYNSFDERAPWKGDLHYVGTIPISMYYGMHREGKTKDQSYLRKWLNSREFRFFRTRPGKI